MLAGEMREREREIIASVILRVAKKTASPRKSLRMSLDALRLQTQKTFDFDEGKHPRDGSGKFTSGSGGEKSDKKETRQVKKKKDKSDLSERIPKGTFRKSIGEMHKKAEKAMRGGQNPDVAFFDIREMLNDFKTSEPEELVDYVSDMMMDQNVFPSSVVIEQEFEEWKKGGIPEWAVKNSLKGMRKDDWEDVLDSIKVETINRLQEQAERELEIADEFESDERADEIWDKMVKLAKEDGETRKEVAFDRFELLGADEFFEGLSSKVQDDYLDRGEKEVVIPAAKRLVEQIKKAQFTEDLDM